MADISIAELSERYEKSKQEYELWTTGGNCQPGSQHWEEVTAKYNTARDAYDVALRSRAATNSEIGVAPTSGSNRRVFVIHGRDTNLRSSIFAFLHAIGLEPLEWSTVMGLTGKASPYIGEILDAAFKHAQAALVLLTPDDEARLRPDLTKDDDPDYEKKLSGQARPNVLFEAGMAFSSHPDRTVLVQVGTIRPFSDIAGRHIVRMDNSAVKRHELAGKLRTAGCPVDLDKEHWLNAGDFSPHSLRDMLEASNAESESPSVSVQSIPEKPTKAMPTNNAAPPLSTRRIPKIEDDPDVNALNIRITNDFEKTGLRDCFIYLHRRSLVDRKARTPLPSFQVMRLTSNHHDIPYMEERRYQLLEFTNPAQPFFRTYGSTVDLPCMGLWRVDLELVWYGAQPYEFSKCFMWEGGRSPYFAECPSGNADDIGTSKQTSDDPRVYLSIEERKVNRFNETRNVFVAFNQGGAEARNIQIDFPLAVGTMIFKPVDVLGSKDKEDMIAEVSGERWPTKRYDILAALHKQPLTLEKVGEGKEYKFTLTYENHNLTRRFECPVTLVFRSLQDSLKRVHDLAVNDANKIAEIKHGECKVTVA